MQNVIIPIIEIKKVYFKQPHLKPLGVYMNVRSNDFLTFDVDAPWYTDTMESAVSLRHLMNNV